MKLQYKIMLFMTIILTATLGIVSLFSFYEMQENVREQMSRNVQNTAAVIASMTDIQQEIGKPNGADKIQEIVEKIRLKTKVQFITVMDMEGIRYSHPIPEKIGKKFTGRDEERCLKEGQTYVSQGEGSLGYSLRAFTPIYKEGTQVGAVSVGILIGDLNKEFFNVLKRFVPYIAIGLVIGIIGSIILAYNIKKTIFGMEPNEIAWKLKIKQMAEALTGFKEMAWNLRAQNHEFMNKLQTISGLIQLEEYDKAVEFIQHTSRARNELIRTLSDNIKVAPLAGLLLSKYNKASEAKVDFCIDDDSYISKLPSCISEDEVICVVGNLIENSLEAVMGREAARIIFRIIESDDKVKIEVSNNGAPIPEEFGRKIFERGSSTKEGFRGFGLNNVKQIIDRVGGQISFVTGDETSWHVTI
jgi:sensor histidine kinase regulating citrate/malate metabolism